LSSEGPATPAVNLMTGEIIDEDGAGQ
jgi:excinuclease ABC subunit C